MFLRDFLGDEAKHGGVDVEEVEVDGRDAVVTGEDGGDHVVADEAEFDECKAEAATMFALVVESLSEALGAKKIFAYENFA
jgi:hypothetical protein